MKAEIKVATQNNIIFIKMNQYSVIVSTQIPYPWSQTYTVQASNYHTAASRGVLLFRKELKKKKRIVKTITLIIANAGKLKNREK